VRRWQLELSRAEAESAAHPEPETRELAPEAASLDIGEQLLYTAVIKLLRDYGNLKKRVSDLEARERI
jgi:hypothetical protein